MIVRICCFTKQGKEITERLKKTGQEFLFQERDRDASLEDWTGECFARKLPIVFVGACGIAVRAIAPFVKDKLTDSPVLVIDEGGRFVIPVLSGHMGGANELAVTVAELLGAEPVITTATDVENLFSVDVFARKNGLQILNRQGIRLVSGKLLRGETVNIAVAPEVRIRAMELPQGVKLIPYSERQQADVLIYGWETKPEPSCREEILLLRAREYICGMGCKKGKTFEELLEFLKQNCREEILEGLSAIATIDLKEREEGLIGLAQYLQVPFRVYSAEQLSQVGGDFTESEFVKQVTGVSNVCERSALYCAGEGGRIVCRKIAKDGCTLAIAKRIPEIVTWET